MNSTVVATSIERHAGIDFGRFIAIIGVILIHSAGAGRFLKVETGADLQQFGINPGVVIEQICRFAVPFFFCASGYFLARQNSRALSNVLIGIARRIIPIYFIWSLFYVLITSKRMIWLTDPMYVLEWLVNGGPGYHLWFLPALGVNMALAAYLRRRLLWKAIFIIAIVLYVTGLMLGSYLPLFIHNPDPVFNMVSRDLPCFGLIFVIAGMYLAESPPPPPKLTTSIIICIFGAALHLTEAAVLDRAGLMPFQANNYLLGTLAFGIGAFLVTLNFKNVPKLFELFAEIGRLNLGIYAVHVFFLIVARHFLRPTELYERLSIAFFVLLLSCLAALVVSRIKPLRLLVR